MDEVTITSEEESPEDSSAHEAAVAEGASAVHADNAEEAASQAVTAAESTVQAAQVSIEATVAANEAAERAEDAAERSQVTLEVVHSALIAQGEVMNAFMAEMREAKKPAPSPKPEPVERSSDQPPASKKKKPNGMLFARR